jgi:hypothetical protein
MIELIALNLRVSKTVSLSDLLTSQELPSAGSERNARKGNNVFVAVFRPVSVGYPMYEYM